MEDAWVYKGQRGHCARCNARVATAELIAAASQAAQNFHTPANLSELQKIFHDAKDFTLQVLQEKPQDASDPTILPHILKAWAGDSVVTFGRHGGGSASDPVHMLHSATDQDQGKWEVKLNAAPEWCPLQSVEAMKTDLEFKTAAQVRLANCLGVEKAKVRITDIVAGSVIIEFTVDDLSAREKERILSDDEKLTGKLRKQFNTFSELKISPAVFALHFDLDQLDSRGNKVFGQGQTLQVGPPTKERSYHQPTGWIRYGFKVLGKYEDDQWLHPFQHPGNWYRAFHGTGRAAGGGDAAARNIVSNGFRQSKGGSFGPGVYVTPFVEYSESGYAGKVTVETTQGQQNFKFLLQVAVEPNGIITEGRPKPNGENQEWILQEGSVRPYGLLIKKV